MDNRVNIAVVVGVIFVLAFAVTLTQSDKQVESQVNEDEIPEELIYEWLKKYDPSEQTISVSGTATASSSPDTLISFILGKLKLFIFSLFVVPNKINKKI